MAADLCSVAGFLRRRHPGLPLYVIVESMDAAVALVAQDRLSAGLGDCSLRCDGLVLR
jgi:alpha-beta hydrolase superfamily lysophospholipase